MTDRLADLYAEPEHHPVPFTPGTKLTAAMLSDRLESIRGLCVAGQSYQVLIAELQYVVDVLKQMDRSTRR